MLDRNGFRGWWIVGDAFLAQGVMVGLTIMSYAVFITPISQAFDTSFMVVNLGLSIVLLTITLGGPLVGGLLDRTSIRTHMTCGACIGSLAWLGMSFATELWQLGLGMAGAALGMVLSGPLAAGTVVAKWFDRKRGMASGIAAMGPPAGGLLLVPLTGWLVEEYDWRTTLRCFSLLALSLAPLHFWIIRNQPRDLGQTPDGAPPHEVEGPPSHAPSPREIVTAKDFWMLALMVGILFGVGSGWGANSIRFIEDLGHDTETAAWIAGIGMGLGIAGTLFFGALADRVGNRRLFAAILMGQIAGLLYLRTSPDHAGLLVCFGTMGLLGGGQLPLFASMIGRLFGPHSFGQVFGLCNLVMLPFGSLSAPILGALRDSTGDYHSAIGWVMASYLVSLALLLGLRIPKRSPG